MQLANEDGGVPWKRATRMAGLARFHPFPGLQRQCETLNWLPYKRPLSRPRLRGALRSSPVPPMNLHATLRLTTVSSVGNMQSLGPSTPCSPDSASCRKCYSSTLARVLQGGGQKGLGHSMDFLEIHFPSLKPLPAVLAVVAVSWLVCPLPWWFLAPSSPIVPVDAVCGVSGCCFWVVFVGFPLFLLFVCLPPLCARLFISSAGVRVHHPSIGTSQGTNVRPQHIRHLALYTDRQMETKLTKTSEEGTNERRAGGERGGK